MVPGVLCVIVLFRPVWSVDEKAGRQHDQSQPAATSVADDPGAPMIRPPQSFATTA